MKRIVTMIVAAATLLCGCSQRDYISEVQQKIEDFQSFYNETVGNKEMDDKQKEEVINKQFEIIQKEVSDIAFEGLAKHNDDSVAVEMVRSIYFLELTDSEGINGIIEKLGPFAGNDPFIVKLKNSLKKEAAACENSQFIDFEIVQPSGKKVKLSDYAGRGNYCLVDFWASWCAPCKGEIPNIKKVYEKYRKKGLEVVSVAVWDNVLASIDTAKAYGISWKQILDAQSIPTELYGITGIPFIMLIGPDGTILKKNLRGDDIERYVAEYLK